MLERYPDDWRGFDKNSHYLAATGRLEDSLAQTHKALSLSPKNGGLHTRAGRLLLSQGKLAEAAQAFRDAIPLWHHELPWMGLIETLVRQGDSEVAREVAASAVRRFPDRLDIEPMVNQRLAVG
jgi:tetratricopeptide (TPR) repeat protein